MAKKTGSYQCTECGWTSVRWVGRCGECQTWGSVVEIDTRAPARTVTADAPSTPAVLIGEVDRSQTSRFATGIDELDRVLGGGIVPGGVILLAGEPGVGKSTLLLEVAAQWARTQRTVLYVSGEESAAQVRMRADRTNTVADDLYVASETDLAVVLGHVEQVKPSLLIVDSVQTIAASDSGAPGGVAQVREVTSALVRVAKNMNIAVILVGHVTKDGAIAGPRTLEHHVDVVLTFEGERHSGFRMVRAAKNRFGPADEVGCFEMDDSGIVEVPDPSGIFLTTGVEPVPGTCVTVTMQGTRPLLSEIQALVATAPAQVPPKRVTHGISNSRISMILAVLQRRARLPLSHKDVYVSTVGGSQINDPSSDLAAALAIASAAADHNHYQKIVALGEVGLAGDLRRVPALERRVGEAARLGFELAIVPAGNRDPHTKLPRLHGLKVVEAATVADAIGLLGLRRNSDA